MSQDTKKRPVMDEGGKDDVESEEELARPSARNTKRLKRHSEIEESPKKSSMEETKEAPSVGSPMKASTSVSTPSDQ